MCGGVTATAFISNHFKKHYPPFSQRCRTHAASFFCAFTKSRVRATCVRAYARTNEIIYYYCVYILLLLRNKKNNKEKKSKRSKKSKKSKRGKKKNAQKCKLWRAAAFRGFSLVKKLRWRLQATDACVWWRQVRFSHCCHVNAATTIEKTVCLESRWAVFWWRVAQKTAAHLNTCAIRPCRACIVVRFLVFGWMLYHIPFLGVWYYAVFSKNFFWKF